MAAQIRTLLEAVRDALRANHAHYDLRTVSSTTRVQIGRVLPSAAPPFASIWLEALECSYGPSLGQWTYTARIAVAGFVAGTAETPESRILAALDLQDDLTTAVNSAFSSPSANVLFTDLHSLLFSATALDGADVGAPEWGVVEGQLLIEYSTTAGV